MPFKSFNGNKEHTVGVELELQLIDPNSRDLVSGASKILQSLNGYSNIKPELFECVIEINSKPCKTIEEVKTDLMEHIQVLHKHTSKLGMKLTMTGTHPKSSWANQTISPVKRYQDLAKRIQMPVKRMLTYGLHVHVGVGSGDEAVAINNALMDYLPHLLAISTSSPYWVKRDSGMESYRSKIFETLPTTGIPFKLHSWEDYCDLVLALQKAGTIESIRDIWWDTRPHPDFGTVEIRVCDAVPLLEDVASIVALVQSLVAYLAKRYRLRDEIGHLPSFLVRENKWRAARYGSDGEIIINSLGTTMPLQEAVEKLLGELGSTARELQAEEELNNVRKIFKRGTSSKRQRQVYAETKGDWDKIVESLIDEFEQSWQLKSMATKM